MLRYFKGQIATNCLPSLKWSNAVPTCECPKCYTGPHCQYSTSWANLSKPIPDKAFLVSIAATIE